jgi:hypothetical protein
MRGYRGKQDLTSLCLVLFLLMVSLILCAAWIMQWAGCRLLRVDRAQEPPILLHNGPAASVDTGKGHGHMAMAAGLNGPQRGEG